MATVSINVMPATERVPTRLVSGKRTPERFASIQSVPPPPPPPVSVMLASAVIGSWPDGMIVASL